MSSDEARKKLEYIQEFQRRLEHATKVVGPELERQREVAEWELFATDVMRPHLPSEVFSSIEQGIARSHRIMHDALPMMPDYSLPGVGVRMLTISTSATTSYAHAEIANLDPSKFKDDPRVAQVRERYQQIQSHHELEQRAAVNLAACFPGLDVVTLFAGICRDFPLARSGLKEIVECAGQMRTFLDKLKGELFDAARIANGQPMDWSLIASRFAPADSEPERHQILLEAEHRHYDLVGRLSRLLKLRQEPTKQELVSAWSGLIDHVYVVCGCIRDSKRT
jgi:hypothetical protein